MDFMTSAAYWGIAVLVIVNGVIVLRMEVDINDDGEAETDPTKFQTGI